MDGLLFALLTLVPVALLRNLFARLLRPGKKGRWARLWWRIMEWYVFKVAQLGRQRPAIAASEPTEVALGAGAQELFLALPKELRTRFAEVPEALERLEAQARRLRATGDTARGERLGSTLIGGGSHRLSCPSQRLRSPELGCG